MAEVFGFIIVGLIVAFFVIIIVGVLIFGSVGVGYVFLGLLTALRRLMRF